MGDRQEGPHGGEDELEMGAESFLLMSGVLAPFFREAHAFRLRFPMAGSICRFEHSEIGTRVCKLFEKLGAIAAALEDLRTEVVAIGVLVRAQSKQERLS